MVGGTGWDGMGWKWDVCCATFTCLDALLAVVHVGLADAVELFAGGVGVHAKQALVVGAAVVFVAAEVVGVGVGFGFGFVGVIGEGGRGGGGGDGEGA